MQPFLDGPTRGNADQAGGATNVGFRLGFNSAYEMTLDITVTGGNPPAPDLKSDWGQLNPKLLAAIYPMTYTNSNGISTNGTSAGSR